MRTARSIHDLLPGHDPPVWPAFHVFCFILGIVVIIAFIVMVAATGNVAFGPLKIAVLIVTGAAVWLVVQRMLPGIFKKTRGTKADDGSLREEIRQWKGTKGGR